MVVVVVHQKVNDMDDYYYKEQYKHYPLYSVFQKMGSSPKVHYRSYRQTRMQQGPRNKKIKEMNKIELFTKLKITILTSNYLL